jgi:two-component system response regulator AtoC
MRILLVDDEEDILESLGDVLTAALPKATTVAKATSLREAQRQVAADEFDLVLTDERMPGGTGSELLTWLRAHHPDVHRGLMSAYIDVRARFDDGRTDAEFFIHKPFEITELVPLVERTVASRGGAPSRRGPGPMPPSSA